MSNILNCLTIFEVDEGGKSMHSFYIYIFIFARWVKKMFFSSRSAFIVFNLFLIGSLNFTISPVQLEYF